MIKSNPPGKPRNSVKPMVMSTVRQATTEKSDLLEQIEAYRLSDPNFEQALEAFIEGEILYGDNDPAQGTLYDVEPPTIEVRRKRTARSATANGGEKTSAVRGKPQG